MKIKIVQDGLHLSSSQAAHLICLSCCIGKQLILSCLYFLYAGLKNSPGWVTPWYPTSNPIGVLGLPTLEVTQFWGRKVVRGHQRSNVHFHARIKLWVSMESLGVVDARSVNPWEGRRRKQEEGRRRKKKKIKNICYSDPS